MEGLFGGNWYRSAVELKGDKIIPIPPFEPYNPFDWYYSASEIRQGQRSLYLEFLAVDSNEPKEVLNFCQRFGVLGLEEAHVSVLSPDERYLLKVAEYLNIISKKAKKTILSKPGKFYELKEKLDFYLAKIEAQDPKECQKIFEYLGILRRESARAVPEEICIPMRLKFFANSQNQLRNALHPKVDNDPILIANRLNFTIGNINQVLFTAWIRPYLQWDLQKGQARLFWESHTLIGILWLMAMLDFLGPGKILSCPRCHKFFMTASNRIKFCSPSCYGNFKVQEYQKRKREKALAGQKVKKVKTGKSTGKNE